MATVNLPVNSGPADGVAFDGTSIWVANNTSGSVSKIDITSNAVDTVGVGANAYGIAFDGSFIWVVNYGSGTVSKINIATNAVAATVTVGTNPFGIAFDGAYMWVGDSGSPVKAHKIDINTNTVAATVELAQSTTDGGGTRGIAFDGTHILVAQLEGRVNKIDVASNTLVARFQAATKGFGLARRLGETDLPAALEHGAIQRAVKAPCHLEVRVNVPREPDALEQGGHR